MLNQPRDDTVRMIYMVTRHLFRLCSQLELLFAHRTVRVRRPEMPLRYLDGWQRIYRRSRSRRRAAASRDAGRKLLKEFLKTRAEEVVASVTKRDANARRAVAEESFDCIVSIRNLTTKDQQRS